MSSLPKKELDGVTLKMGKILIFNFLDSLLRVREDPIQVDGFKGP